MKGTKTILLTGAARGIGLATATALLEAGHRLVATDIDDDLLHSAFATLVSDGAEASGEKKRQLLLARLDISDYDEWVEILKRAEGHFGPLDVLINNAAVIEPGFIAESDQDHIDRHVDVNLKGTLYGTSLAAARMSERGNGHIINIASLAGIAPVPGIAAYAATKFGVRGYSLAAAHELKRFGIAVSVICPDLVDTRMLDQQLKDDTAAVTFSGSRPLSTDEVVRAILNALDRQMLEITLPGWRGFLARLSSLWPAAGAALAEPMASRGRKSMERLRRSRPLILFLAGLFALSGKSAGPTVHSTASVSSDATVHKNTSTSPTDPISNTTSPDAIVGTWIMPDGNFHVHIERSGDIYKGHLSWMQYGTDDNGLPVLDKLNPNPQLRDRPVLGIECLSNLRWDGDATYRGGTMYYFEQGRSYRAQIKLVSDDRALLRGYIGLPVFGQTKTFIRVED